MKSYLDQCDLAERSQRDFVRILLKLQRQYQKLWDENLKLIKHIEESSKSNQLSTKHNSQNNPKVLPSASNNENENIFIKTEKNTNNSMVSNDEFYNEFKKECEIPDVLSLNFDSGSEPTHNKTNEQTEDEVIRSPIISKQRRRRKKHTHNKSNLESDANESIDVDHKVDFPDTEFEEAMCQVPTEIDKTNVPLKSVLNKSKLTNSINYDSLIESDDEIKLKKPKVCRKIVIDKHAAENIEISVDGRKLVQSKLVLQKAKPESIFNINDSNFRSDWAPIVKQNVKCEQSKSKCDEFSQDIIENSILHSPMRPYKLKKKLSLSSQKLIETKKSLFQTTPQKDESKSNMVKDIKKEKENHLESSMFVVIPSPKQQPETSGEKLKKDDQQKKLSFDESSLNDETFFSPGERHILKQYNEAVLEDVDLEEKSLPSNHEIASKKVLPYVSKPVRGKKRAVLEGWDCARCEEFYDGMDYTERELKKLKNACSRHRSKFNERIYTPDGFWNPVFSQPYTQTNDKK